MATFNVVQIDVLTASVDILVVSVFFLWFIV